MRKFTLFASLLSLLAIGQSASAANWANRVAPAKVISCAPANLDVEIISGGRFTELGQYIGNTGGGTTLSLGSVDFGAANSIKGVTVEMGSGWGDDDGTAVFKIGDTYATSTEIARVTVNRTNAYDDFNQFYNTISMRNLSGVHNLYVTFEGRCGNVKSFSLYNQNIPQDQVTNARGNAKRLLNPWEFDGYADDALRLVAEEATNIGGNDSHIDTNNGSWGWIKNGTTIEYVAKDFGDGGWEQVAIEFNHGDASFDHYIEVYLDEVGNDNLIAKFWNGWNLGNNFTFAGKTLTQDITGQHKIVVRWSGASASGNLRTVDFYKEARYPEAPYFNLQDTRENYTPAADAKHITFTGPNANEYEILSTKGEPRIEGNGNIGYTSDGTVFKFKNVDFGENQFKNVIVDAGREEQYSGHPRSARYDVYIDLENNGTYSADDWNNNLNTITAGHETVARPYLQGTGGWGNRMNTMSPINTEISGVHDLYFVMRTNGANVYGIYMEYNDEVVVEPEPEVVLPEIAISIPTSETNPDVKILASAAFPESNPYIGNVGGDTKVELGSVDFGDGEALKAVSIEIAHGWYIDNAYAILSAGDSYESSLPFAQIAIEETGDYDRNWNLYVTNFTCNQGTDSELWSGGTEAIEGIEYENPEGVNNVYLEFVNGGGNIRSVNFYADEIDAKYTSKVNNFADMLMRPAAFDEYARDYATILEAKNSTAINANGDTPRLDGDSWGWTNAVKGFKADFGELDFGNGDFTQLALNFKHYRNNPDDYIEVYVDSDDEQNLIAKFFTGLNLDNNLVTIAQPISKITGTHRVIVKWNCNVVGSGTNVRQLHFLKSNLWPTMGDKSFTTENYEPAEGSKLINFKNHNYTILHRGQIEGDGNNIGWTGNGTSVVFHNVDFGTKLYNKIVVEHSNPQGYMGSIAESNMKYYLGDALNLESSDSWTNNDNRNSMLSNVSPVATVRIQGSNDWGNHTKASAPLADITGIHDLVVVMNSPIDNTACNLFNIWLEKNPATDGVENVSLEGAEVSVADGAIVLTGAARVYNLQGQLVAEVAEAASVNVAAGIYVVRTADRALKVVVK